MDSRRSCFIANLMNIECDSKKADLNETYNEWKKKTVVQKVIWRAGMKNDTSQDQGFPY